MMAPGIFIWGTTAPGFWGWKSPVESRGEAPVGVLGDFLPQKLKQFADTV